ncbi:MAG: aspartate--tRNA ligase [Candidatus Woesearchaeota archaeon]
MLRTHNCNQSDKSMLNTKVILCGWVASKRNHGGVIFIDLRDHYGITQIVFEPSVSEDNARSADDLPRESVIRVEGIIRMRPKGQENSKLNTGDVEVRVETLELLSVSSVLPIETDDYHIANDEVRLEYRYLDLRRPSMQEAIVKRSDIVFATHEFMVNKGFINIETPFLMRSTPEGARDFLVPSRLHNACFYALPQSPQLYKQLSMISGFDKYYQIVKCMRDEDLRADRQPEFTQFDMELSFAEEEDIFSIIEELFAHIGDKVFDKKISIPFERITYKEALESYGSDKPDVRFDMKISDVTTIVEGSSFQVFEGTIKQGGKIKGLRVINPQFSRNDIDDIIAYAQQNKAKGLAWMRMTDNGLESNIVKFFSKEQQDLLIKHFNVDSGDILFFAADNERRALEIMGKVRLHLGTMLNFYDKNEWKFLWVIDFPYFSYDDDTKKWEAEHHPFTNINHEDLGLVESDPGNVRARAYDITLNGWELGSGSIRIHDSVLQERMFKALGLSKETIDRKFGWFIKALQYGVPPHGGIAFGFDRFVALLLGKDNIREVIAFPKNKSAQNPMDGSPAIVSEEQLNELGLELKKKS